MKTKRILLIDTDSKIPNVALAKLASYHKAEGDTVELKRLEFTGYYNKRRKPITVDAKQYNTVFVSTIFTCNADKVTVTNCTDVRFGGTGIDASITLPAHIDVAPMDYSIYHDAFLKKALSRKYKSEEKREKAFAKVHKLTRTAFGFLTRGCIRKCEFCFVPEKEGWIRSYNTIDEIYDSAKYDRVDFMDNNILAHPNHMAILTELRDRKIKCQFTQGLDIRLLNEENAKLLRDLNYDGEYIFAFDRMELENVIKEKLKLLKKVGFKKALKFYVFVSPKFTDLKKDIYRIEFLRKRGILPYIMREISCWHSPYEKLYTDLASWCVQPAQFKKRSFKVWLNKRHPNDSQRVEFSLQAFNQFAKGVDWTTRGWMQQA